MRIFLSRLFLFAAFAAALPGQWIAPNPVTGLRRQSDGAVLSLGTGALRIQVCTDSIVHVIYSPTESFPNRPEYVVMKTAWPGAVWTVRENPGTVTIATGRMSVVVDRKDATIAFNDVS